MGDKLWLERRGKRLTWCGGPSTSSDLVLFLGEAGVSFDGVLPPCFLVAWFPFTADASKHNCFLQGVQLHDTGKINETQFCDLKMFGTFTAELIWLSTLQR